MHIEFNWLAMIIATVAAFMVGFLWYGPLFGKKWGTEMGMDMEAKPDMSKMYKPMMMQVVGSFLIAYSMTWMMGAGGTHWDGYHMALMPALLVWAGFFVPQHLGEVAWQERSWTLFGINAGGNLVIMIVIASILYFMM